MGWYCKPLLLQKVPLETLDVAVNGLKNILELAKIKIQSTFPAQVKHMETQKKNIYQLKKIIEAMFLQQNCMLR